MIMLRNIYEGRNICAFDNETDAFEMLMALTEEMEYEEFQNLYLNYGYDYKVALGYAQDKIDYFVEGSIFQEFPYIEGNFPHLKEGD